MGNHLIWNIDPQVFSFSEVPRWYGLIFAGGIVGGYALMKRMFIKEHKDIELVDKLLVYVFVGMLVGMRLGHCFFYEADQYLRDPIRIFKIWEGGYASHGGFAGLIVAILLFCRKYKSINIMWLLDRMTIPSMFAAGAIRVGNFFNSEMVGRTSDVPWAIVFKLVDDNPRHPGQLYEAIGFFTLFGVGLYIYSKEKLRDRRGLLLGTILTFGMSWRFFVEFFKENQVGFENDMVLNMGQILSIPFIAVGIYLLWNTLRNPMPVESAPHKKPPHKRSKK